MPDFTTGPVATKPSLATAFRDEMQAARAAWRAGDPDADFGLLALAGIVGAMEQRRGVPPAPFDRELKSG